MKTDYKYINFADSRFDNRKTEIFTCFNRKSDAILGQVKWKIIRQI